MHLDVAVPAHRAAEALGQLAEDHPVANPVMLARVGAGRPSPALTEPLSSAPSRMASRWASIVPSTRPFSRTERLRALSSPLNSPAISTASATTLASTRAPFAQDQAAGQLDLAAEPSQDLGVFALAGCPSMSACASMMVVALSMAASRMRGHSTVGGTGPRCAGVAPLARGAASSYNGGLADRSEEVLT